MSEESFLRLLQELLTMISKDDTPENRERALTILRNLYDLAISSHAVDQRAFHMIRLSISYFDYLARHASEFAGVPGDFAGNRQKRNRLIPCISPSC